MFVDYLKIFVPLVRDQRYAIGATSLYDGVRDCILDRDDGLWQLDFAAFSELTGTPLQARQVHFESGKASYTDLTSHWDSYASSEAYLAVRTVQARHNIGLSAGVEIQCSPATIAHIQNIISDIRSVELAAWIILSAAEQALPDIWPFLRLEGALVLRLDCTDGLYAETPAQAQQIIDRCRRVAYGQRKSSDTVGYKTSVYYGETSELHRGIAYHKGPEHQKKVAAAEAELRRSPTSVMAKRRLDCLKNPDLIAMADRQVRLEARWLKRGLTDHLTRLGCTPEDAPWDGRLQSLIALERTYNAEHNTEKSLKKTLVYQRLLGLHLAPSARRPDRGRGTHGSQRHHANRTKTFHRLPQSTGPGPASVLQTFAPVRLGRPESQPRFFQIDVLQTGPRPGCARHIPRPAPAAERHLRVTHRCRGRYPDGAGTETLPSGRTAQLVQTDPV